MTKVQQPLLPPNYYLQRGYHHWVQRRDFDGRACGLEVYQWQPGVQKWCLPNQYACGADKLLEGYEWVAVCPTPPFEEELAKVQAILDTYDRELRNTPDDSSIVMSKDEYRQLRTMLYEQVIRGG